MLTYYIILYKNTESTTQDNIEDHHADIQPPQIDDELDNGQEQRDVTTRNNPSYEMTILKTEV